MLKIAVCDDNQAICLDIKNVCFEFASQNYIDITVDIYNSGQALLKALSSFKYYDLLFLDIELGDITGVDVGLIIRNKLKQYIIEIVYITSYVKYALSLFQVQPMDFVLKPLHKEKLFLILAQFMEQHDISSKIFCFKIGRHEQKVPLTNILYFESLLKEIRLYTLEGEFVQFYSSLKKIREELLEIDAQFLFPHKSYLVNYKRIEEFHYDYLLMQNKVQIPIGRSHRNEIREYIKQWEERCL